MKSKSKKTYARSFRYSAEVAAILENFGDKQSSLNDRFEQLVLFCNLELSNVEEKVAQQRKKLHELEEDYRKLLKKVSDTRAVGRELDSMLVEFGMVKKRLVEINSKCNTI